MNNTQTRWTVSLFVFVGLAYAVSWLIWLPQLAEARGWTDAAAWKYLHLIGGIGPMVAGITVTWRFSGAEALRRLFRRSVAFRDWRWLAIGAFGPVLLFGGGVLVARVTDGAWPDLSRFGGTDEFASLGLALYWLGNLIFYGFGEEVGWRGVLLPRLQTQMSALSATMIVAVVWTLWHLPLFWFVEGYTSMDLAGFGGLFFSFLTGAVIMTWLYNASGGNLLAVALFHASLDITINTPTSTGGLPSGMGFLITVAGLALLWRYGPKDLAPIPRQTENVTTVEAASIATRPAERSLV